MRAASRGSLPRARAAQGPRAPHGFTLLEMLAASTIFAIIMVAVYMMYETNQNTFATGDARAAAQQNARVALDDITTAIRMAGSFYCAPPPWVPWPSPSSPCPASLGYLTPESSYWQPGSSEAVRIATADTLALHAGYKNPGGVCPPKCNAYVTYSLWTASGARTTTLYKWTLVDPWNDPSNQSVAPEPLAENVIALTFTYFDASGFPIPNPLPAPTTPKCSSSFPFARPSLNYALDGQGPVSGATVPSTVSLGSQRFSVQMIRVQITIESNISYDATSGCYRRHVGGPSQAFTLISETYTRSVSP